MRGKHAPTIAVAEATTLLPTHEVKFATEDQEVQQVRSQLFYCLTMKTLRIL